jgi:hypothetical protein
VTRDSGRTPRTHALALRSSLVLASLSFACVEPSTEPDPLGCGAVPIHRPTAVSLGETGTPAAADELVLFGVDTQTEISIRVEVGATSGDRCWWIVGHLYVIGSTGEPVQVFSTSQADPDLRLEDSSAVVTLGFPVAVDDLAAMLGDGELYLEAHLIPDVGPEVQTSIYALVTRFAPVGVAPPTGSKPATSCSDWGEDLAAALLDPEQDRVWGPDLAAELVVGVQGATMMTPRVTIENSDDLAQECVLLDLVATTAGTHASLASAQGVQYAFVRGDDGWLTSTRVFLPFLDEQIEAALVSGADVSVIARLGTRRVRTRVFVPVVDEEQ